MSLSDVLRRYVPVRFYRPRPKPCADTGLTPSLATTHAATASASSPVRWCHARVSLLIMIVLRIRGAPGAALMRNRPPHHVGLKPVQCNMRAAYDRRRKLRELNELLEVIQPPRPETRAPRPYKAVK